MSVEIPTIFVSFTRADRAWAEWIAWQVREAGYAVRFQPWDVAPGSSWPEWMERSAGEADHTLVVLSQAALRSGYARAEWQVAFQSDPLGERRGVILVRVEECDPPRFLGVYDRVDLMGRSLDDARAEVLRALRTAHTGDGWPATGPRFPGPGRPPPFPGAAPDAAVEAFLSRVEQACRDRYPDATIERVKNADQNFWHLFVTAREAGYSRRWPVGIAADGVDQQVLDAFVEHVHARYEARDPDVESELVYGGQVIDPVIARRARRLGVLVRSLPEYQRQWDPRRYLAEQAKRLAADPVYPPRLYISQRYRRRDGGREGPPADDVFAAVLDWLDAESARLIVVLGNFGHGKTFLLKELTRQLPALMPTLVPVLVQMRTLEKSHSVDALLAAHLVAHGEESFDIAAVRRMVERGQVVLLFDGFDELALEVSYDRAAEHLRTILSVVKGRAKVVVSSRTQHFASDAQWRTVLADEVHLVAGSRLVELEDFTDDQIREFLVRLYGGDEAAAGERFELIHDIKDLLGLSRNPRMLSFIAELDADELRTVRAAGGISSAQLYERLISRWLRFEVNRRRPTLGAVPGLDVGQIRRAVTVLAETMWTTAQFQIGVDRLEEVTSRALTDLTRPTADPAQATYAIGSASLLVRGEEDRFGFVHSSVMEYLVAVEAARRLSATTEHASPATLDETGDPGDTGTATSLLAAREMSALMADFFCEAAGQSRAQEWIRSVRDDDGATAAAKANVLAVAARLQVRGLRIRLAGQDLRRQPLSGLDLRFADLSGANLAGTRLRGVDLTGARLRSANLGQAHLEDVVLDRTDLSAADLRGARLRETTLRGARTADARWDRAALLGVTADYGVLGQPAFAAAAVVGRVGSPRAAEVFARAVVMPPRAEVRSVAFAGALSVDGTLAAAWGRDVALIEAYEGRVTRVLRGDEAAVSSVALAPDASAVAAARFDGTVVVWDAATGQRRRTFHTHDGDARSVAFSPDGSLLASGGADHAVRLWDVQSGQERLRLSGHEGRVYAVAFSPNGRFIAAGAADRTVRVWRTDTGVALHTLIGHTGWVAAVAFSPDGSMLATAGYTSIRVWDTQTGEQTGNYPGHAGGAWSVAFSPDGRRLASGGADDAVHLRDLATGRLGTLARHTARVWSVAFSPGGDLLASGSADGTVEVTDVESGRRRCRVAGRATPATSVSVSPSGGVLVSGRADGTVRVWELASARGLAGLRGPRRPVNAVAVDPSGAFLAGADGDRRHDGEVHVWDARTGRRLAPVTGHSGAVTALAFSPSADLLASLDVAGTVIVSQPSSGTRRLTLGTGDVACLAFNHDGTALATGHHDGAVRLRHPVTGDVPPSLGGAAGGAAGSPVVRALAFSPPGTGLALGG
ncbi:MAG: TIR domain-containing protein, partial [Frankia sp.]